MQLYCHNSAVSMHLMLCFSTLCYFCNIDIYKKSKYIVVIDYSCNDKSVVVVDINAFSALTLLVGRQEGYLACKN